MKLSFNIVYGILLKNGTKLEEKFHSLLFITVAAC